MPENGDFTGRFYRFEARDMDLSGPIPSWVLDVPEWGPDGSHSLRRIRVQGNRFTFRDLLPTHEYLKENLGLGDGYRIIPQKPFGESRQRTAPSGGQLVLDLSEFDYEGNEYQWTKDGTPISGANSHTLTISNVSSSDQGKYVLQVKNPALPELETHSSQPITFQIGEDGGGSNDI